MLKQALTHFHQPPSTPKLPGARKHCKQAATSTPVYHCCKLVKHIDSAHLMSMQLAPSTASLLGCTASPESSSKKSQQNARTGCRSTCQACSRHEKTRKLGSQPCLPATVASVPMPYRSIAAIKSLSASLGGGCVLPSFSSSSVGMNVWPSMKLGRLALPPQLVYGNTSNQFRSTTIRPVVTHNKMVVLGTCSQSAAGLFKQIPHC